MARYSRRRRPRYRRKRSFRRRRSSRYRPRRYSRSRRSRSRITIDKNKRSKRVDSAVAECSLYARTTPFNYTGIGASIIYYRATAAVTENAFPTISMVNSGYLYPNINTSTPVDGSAQTTPVWSPTSQAPGPRQSNLQLYFREYRFWRIKSVKITHCCIDSATLPIPHAPAGSSAYEWHTNIPSTSNPVPGREVQSLNQHCYSIPMSVGLPVAKSTYEFDDVIHSAFSKKFDARHVHKRLCSFPATMETGYFTSAPDAASDSALEVIYERPRKRGRWLPVTTIDSIDHFYMFPLMRIARCPIAGAIGGTAPNILAADRQTYTIHYKIVFQFKSKKDIYENI